MSQIARLEASRKCPQRERESQPLKRKASSRGDLTGKKRLPQKFPGLFAQSLEYSRLGEEHRVDVDEDVLGQVVDLLADPGDLPEHCGRRTQERIAQAVACGKAARSQQG